MSDLVHIPALAETEPPAQLRPNVKRHLIAATLSAAVPGAGQLFLGRKIKAIVLFLALAAIVAGFWPARLPKSYPGLIFLLWMCILTCLYAVFEALLAQDARTPGRMPRWWIAAGLPLHYLGCNLVFTSLLFGSGFHTFKFSSSSMEPTIFPGDKFVADERYYRRRTPQRDDLVLMHMHGDSQSVTIKRIIAVGGDTIEGRERKIFLNDQLQDEAFVQHKFRPEAGSEMDTFGPVAVPAGKFFVMGDNRDISLDSRSNEVGLMGTRDIVGRPLYGYRIVGNPLSWELR